MQITNEELSAYLANLLALARVDGKITSSEQSLIGQIQKRIGAKKSTLNHAEKISEKNGFAPKAVGSFADQVKNLEDMVYMALIDGDVDDAEKEFLLNFTQIIGVTQGQFKMILQEVQAKISIMDDGLKCSNCNSAIELSAKFCPNCGTPADSKTNEEAIAVVYKIPQTGITIEFAESTGAGFPFAFEQYQKAPTNAECVRGKKTWYMANWPQEEMHEVLKLVEGLSGLRNRIVHINGEKTKWEDVFSFAYCCRERDSSYRPFEYCFGVGQQNFNIWGCQLARMDWTHWANWFSYGNYVPVGNGKAKFVFDKNRIRHELKTNLFRVRFCPYLKESLVEKVLEIFPNEVYPSLSGTWRFRKDYTDLPGAIQITETEGSGEWELTDEYYSSGVEPASYKIGIDILREAIEKSQFELRQFEGVMKYRGSE